MLGLKPLAVQENNLYALYSPDSSAGTGPEDPLDVPGKFDSANRHGTKCWARIACLVASLKKGVVEPFRAALRRILSTG